MASKISAFRAILIFGFSLLFLAGCASHPKHEASGFLEEHAAKLHENGNYFFEEFVEPDFDFSQYDTVKVAPVNLSHLDTKTACDTTELEKLGQEFRKDIEDNIAKQGFKTTSHPSGQTLIVSVAIINVEPPNALLNAGLTAAGVFCPVPLPFDQDGQTAFEGKVTDGATGNPVIVFAETETGGGEGFDLKAKIVGNYAKFVNTSAVFKRWSGQIGKMLKDLHDKKEPKGKSALAKGASSVLGVASMVSPV